MKSIFFSVSVLLVLASCGGKKTAAAKPVVAGNSQKVTYTDATYYTGMVEFRFKDSAGSEVKVSISNMPEDSGAIYPKYLLESADTLEGIPGANPNVVGKPFLLIKNAAGEVREIKAAN